MKLFGGREGERLGGRGKHTDQWREKRAGKEREERESVNVKPMRG